jgi:hypothetical protein
MLSRVYGSMINNNRFWIGWLDLLTFSFKISVNYGFCMFICFLRNQNLQSCELIDWQKSCDALEWSDEALPQWKVHLSFPSGQLARFLEVSDGAEVQPVAVVCRLSDMLICCGAWHCFFDDVTDVGVYLDLYGSFGCLHTSVHSLFVEVLDYKNSQSIFSRTLLPWLSRTRTILALALQQVLF